MKSTEKHSAPEGTGKPHCDVPAREGTTAFGQLIAAERPALLQYALYRLGSRDDAEDVVQDVCLKLFEHSFVKLKLQSSQTELTRSVHQRLSDGASRVHDLRAYLFRSLINLCTSRERQERPFVAYPPESLPDPAADEAEDFGQEFRRIRRLLASIPGEQAEVIRLRFYGDKNFREIADILGIPLTTAKSRFLYGLEKIRRGMRVPSQF